MGSEWNKQLLGSLCHEITVGFVGSMTQEYVPTGVPFLRSKNIAEYDIDWNDMKYVSKEFHSKLSKSVLKPGDVAIVRTGKPGTTCVVPADLVEANCSDIVIARVNAKLLNPHYLAYFMNAMAHGQVNAHVVGAVQQHFNVGSAKKIEIPLPSILEQEKVVNVLKALDDKFKLNNQINQTLEQIAQTLFKSWFVDFDPVKAKMNGEQAKGMDAPFLSKEVASLFPEKLVESELGLIPEGWSIQTIKALSEKISKGTTPSKKDLASATDEPSIRFIKVKDINDQGEILRDKLEAIPDSIHTSKLKRSILEKEDILFSIAGTIGRVAIVDQDLDNVNTNQAVAFVRLKDKQTYLPLVYMAMRENRLQQKAISSIVQGVQANLSLANVGDMEVIVPSEDILNLWNTQYSSMLQMIKSNFSQSRQLAALRDTLLPKLLLGEIDLESVQVEAAKATAE